MKRLVSHRMLALGETLLVTLIWGSSFVIVKYGLAWVGPLTIAGLRYFIGALALFPWMMRGSSARMDWKDGKMWARLTAIGLSAYVLGNGGMFLGLKFLPATTVSFMMSLTPILVLFGSLVWLHEMPAQGQMLGVLLTLLGSALFFFYGWMSGNAVGFLIVLISLLGFVLFALLGREIARQGHVDTLTLTAIPLFIGGVVMLAIALSVEGIPRVTATSLGIVLWLAWINTALAYFLYNHALRTLTALEVNVVLNLAPLSTAMFAWWWLDERLRWTQVLGISLVILGVVLVQKYARGARQPHADGLIE